MESTIYLLDNPTPVYVKRELVDLVQELSVDDFPLSIASVF
jgi:hypothetical protein